MINEITRNLMKLQTTAFVSDFKVTETNSRKRVSFTYKNDYMTSVLISQMAMFSDLTITAAESNPRYFDVVGWIAK